ncbi:hypothetical protein M011DRAFT_410148 [Sporormia fimetaria CBS 119925]|uniref:DUF7703 domain-containing protein n=1 Tax=Sporormia fimetaria CBS 119925 TaxID=1340428 RepID=A0A6A6UZK7_9PLEO|nr:hypothetical protein M011DRAFT_410148 [Sporormia fimetaria CBS 119925]
MGSDVELSFKTSLSILAFLTIGWYNVAELTVWIQVFFKRYSGLYYYSLLVATWGVFFHGLGTFFKLYRISDNYVANTVIAYVGWIMMVTGQSIVLCSRLHLVVHARWKRWILCMIIVDGTILHTITGVLTFLTNLHSGDPNPWKGPYAIVERIQIAVFFLQEVILSGIYIWKTSVMLKDEGPLFENGRHGRRNQGRRVLIHNIVVNILVIALDATILILQYSGLYDIQTAYKGAVYSIKLKMEFSILNELMNLVKGNQSDATPSRSSKANPGNRTGNRSGVRDVTLTSHTAHCTGAYSRMDDGSTSTPDDIKLTRLENGRVLRTTTTEIHYETTEDAESLDIGAGKTGFRRSSSSEMYIIDRDDSGCV